MQQRHEPNNGQGRLLRRTWALPVAVIALVAGHGIFLQYVSSHTALSAAVVSGLIVQLLIKHMGVLGSAYDLLRKHFRRRG